MSVQTPVVPAAYRPDIDGLRAFAVLAVVIYHAFPNVLPAGFIGVDVFFVISGYLISSIILRDLQQGTFTFWNFYSRRIRRIFPALIAVLVAALAFGWFALLPEEYKALGKHTVGGATFVSNIMLWQEAGYFDVEARAKPLLHLWSLGIEEQFYIFFPLLLWCCFKIRIRLFYVIPILCTASFFYNIYLSYTNGVADFYSPLSRIWELLAGAFLSLLVFLRQCSSYNNGTRENFFYRQVTSFCKYTKVCQNLGFPLALLGLFSLCLALVVVREGQAYPGAKALLAVVGTFLLISAGQDNPVNRHLFANKLSVFIGKISYPFYLWHWVCISYMSIIHIGYETDTCILRTSIIFVSFLLSILTYFFIEKPIRFNHEFKNLKSFMLILFMIFTGFAGWIIYKNDGFPKRYNIDAYTNSYPELSVKLERASERCVAAIPEWALFYSGAKSCKFSKEEKENTVAIIGDSHASHLYAGLLLSKRNNVPGVALFTAPGAAPYIDITSWKNTIISRAGSVLINRGYSYIIKNKNISTVILACLPICAYDFILDSKDRSIKNKDVILENGMRRTFDVLTKNNKKIIVLLDNPTSPFHVRKCIPRNLPTWFVGHSESCQFERKLHDNEPSFIWYKKILSKVVQDYKSITVFDLGSLFCDTKFCHLKKDDIILYSDNSHLTTDGSLFVSEIILDLLEKDK